MNSVYNQISAHKFKKLKLGNNMNNLIRRPIKKKKKKHHWKRNQAKSQSQQ